MGSANERRRYIVTPPIIGWAHTQNDPGNELLVQVNASKSQITRSIAMALTSNIVRIFCLTLLVVGTGFTPFKYCMYTYHFMSNSFERAIILKYTYNMYLAE